MKRLLIIPAFPIALLIIALRLVFSETSTNLSSVLIQASTNYALPTPVLAVQLEAVVKTNWSDYTFGGAENGTVVSNTYLRICYKGVTRTNDVVLESVEVKKIHRFYEVLPRRVYGEIKEGHFSGNITNILWNKFR